MSLPEDVLHTLLRRGGCDRAEVYVKRGRSRRFEVSPSAETAVVSQERGWAVRAGDRRRSFFACGTGEPPEQGPWPAPTHRALELPQPALPPAWKVPTDFDAPLIGETEGLRLLQSLGRDLQAELPRARVLFAALEDGNSEAELFSSLGVLAKYRHRLASLHVQARLGLHGVSFYLAAREARQFQPAALSRRIADRLAVATAPNPPGGDIERGDFLLAPALGAQLLHRLAPFLTGPQPERHWPALHDSRARFGSPALTLIDNGRLPGGVFEAALDGEGVPTREVVLVEDGRFRQPLLAWHQAPAPSKGQEGPASGCSRRPGWRDLPAPGPTHLYWKPSSRVSVAALLREVKRGAYLIDTIEGAFQLDPEADRFSLPVCGFLVENGEARAPLPWARLTGELSALLRGVAGVGRDLSFHPLGGMVGSPTLLVSGVTLLRGA